MRNAVLAQSLADTTNAALAAVSTVSYLLPSKRPLKEGLEALRIAYRVLGAPESSLPWDLGEDRVSAPEPPPKSETRMRQLIEVPSPVRSVRRRKKQRAAPAQQFDPFERDDSAALEASRCRAFLLEVMRRAIHDWVLYRQHTKRELKMLAHEAYIWLFEEGPGHPWWHERQTSYVLVRNERDELQREKGARLGTSFLAICEAVEISPETVRERARKMTVESILRAGRPAERRTRDDNVSIEEHGVVIDIDLQTLDEPTAGEAAQYTGYTSYTPSYM